MPLACELSACLVSSAASTSLDTSQCPALSCLFLVQVLGGMTFRKHGETNTHTHTVLTPSEVLLCVMEQVCGSEMPKGRAMGAGSRIRLFLLM